MKNSIRDPDFSEPLSPRAASDWIDRFESALRQQGPLKVLSFFPKTDYPEFETVVSEILRILLEWRWSKGERGGLEQLLGEDDLNWVRHNPRLLAPVAFEDYRLRKTDGHEVDRELYRLRYRIDVNHWDRWLENPDVDKQEEFTSTVSGYGQTIDLNRSNPLEQLENDSQDGVPARRDSRVDLPEVSSQLGDFELVYLVGSGAFSRVFIARQISLAKRHIVLKITTTPLGESQQLARLQHNNIMPLYFAQYINGLYLLGMPLLGLVTLKEAIESRFGTDGSIEPVDLRSGQTILNLIRHYPAEVGDINLVSHASLQNQEPDADLFVLEYGKLSWENSILAIGQRLADGLQYSHSRGVQHRDIKPANILLGFDGQPLLLDFNLSRLESKQVEHRTRSVGGTLPYMSPEHLEAMDTGIDRFTWRSDVYSLGVVLYEALTGQLPHDSSMFSGGNLTAAIETRRQAIRHPRELNPEIRPAAASIVMKCLEYNPEDRYSTAGELAVDLKLQLSDRAIRYASNPSWLENAGKFRRRNGWLFSAASLVAFAVVMAAIAGAAGFAWRQSSQTTLANGRYLEFVKKAHLAEAELFFADGGSRESGRRLAKEALAVFGFDESDLNSPLHGGRNINLETAITQWLNPVQKEDVVATARLLLRLAHSDSIPLSMGEETTIALATDRVADEQLTPLERASGAFNKRNYLSAIEILDKELEKSYERFAVWFLKGKCHFELREYRDAERCFAIAGMVDPNSATSQIARGSCHYFMSQYDEAKRFFESARQLDENSFAAMYNLALVDERQLEFRSALDWLARAEEIQPKSTRVEMARSRIARAMGNESLAKEALERVIREEPTEPEGWILRGLARLSLSPADAVSDFEKAQQFSVTRFVAGQNRAHVLSEYLKKNEEAIQVLSELLEEDTQFLPALSGRAVLHARGGNREAALRDIRRCVQLQMTPQLHYQIACVYALLATEDDTMRERALHHLAIATAPAYGAHIIAKDADLRNLEGSVEFQSLRNGIRTSNELQRAVQENK